MQMTGLDELGASLAVFSSALRLYALAIDGVAADTLMVEAFFADDTLQGLGERDIIVLSTSAHLKLPDLLGKRASLDISLADGSRSRFSGHVARVGMLGSEGGLARYRICLTPWLARLQHGRNSRVWQDCGVTDIVDTVLAAYAPAAQWRWSDDVAGFMAQAEPRSYCCQYRESDYAFVLRLLTEEGLAWRFEETADGVCMVLFADSTQQGATPEDASSVAGGGLRYHAARAGESQDAIQALHAQRRMQAGLVTLLSYDYKAKKTVAASVPSALVAGGGRGPVVESYDYPGQYFYANAAQAQRYAGLQMEAHEAASHLWQARSTVRTLRAGTRFTLTQGPLSAGGEASDFVVLRVVSVGVNNLPAPAREGLAELFGPIPELLEEVAGERQARLPAGFAQALQQASASGYANCFEALPATMRWRPMPDGGPARHHAKPTAHGAQSAIVIGADGSDQPAGADELYCDHLGRVRIRYHWQDGGDATCWVRVAQRLAGGGMGSQFLPRIGQEVLVQFIENDIDRPIIIGALYNGQGEGGVTPTPAGRPDAASAAQPFDPASDHAPSAQGNLAGGNGPLWHGASAGSDGHRNGAAQWGVRSKEFGGTGYSQLLFDDTDAQGRVQLRATHAGSEMNLGHLIHSADNYRGSLRGQGAELRTDAYGAVRGGAGLLVTSYRIEQGADARDPAGDNAAGIALLKQAALLGETFSTAAKTHEAVALAGHVGAARAGASAIDDKAAPLKALLAAVSGMVDNASVDAATAATDKKSTAPDENRLPHAGSPVIALSGNAGLGVTAGQSIQLANGETVALMNGADSQFVAGGQLRAHSGQAAGVLGGVVKPGEGGIGVQLIAAQDAIDIQAQADVLKMQARDEISVVSANAAADWAAAKRISLSTAGGANITIEGGNITVQCPGKLTIHAGTKHFAGPDKLGFALPAMPHAICKKCRRDAAKSGAPFSLVQG